MEQQNQQPIQEKIESKPPIKTSWKFIAIIVLIATVVSVAGILFLSSQFKIDKCLDHGGRWDYESSRCVNIDTSAWQTYRNDEFGFEVRYPSDWEVTSPFVEKTPEAVRFAKLIEKGVMLHSTS